MARLIEELESLRDVELINTIQFSILRPEDIRRGSVVEVKFPETYDGNIPKTNGLFDPRMGNIDNTSQLCITCQNKAELCPGHFGHINLALPVYNMEFIDTILKILDCVCFRCSNILIDKSNPDVMNSLLKKSANSRLNAVIALASKVKTCQYNNGCMVIQPKKYMKNKQDKMVLYEKNLIYQIIAEFPSEAIKDKDNKKDNLKKVITPQICLNILKKISEEDCEFLGFSNKYSRPEWMIFTVLPVPPPAMRPSVRQDNNQRSEDDLTYALVNIVKNNKILQEKIEECCPKDAIDTYYGMVQYYVATFINNEIQGVQPQKHRNDRILKSIVQRHGKKEGRMRGNIQGKRVDFSSRSVISVDPKLSIDEFGVPIEIAMNLTIPEIVTKYNMNDMYALVRNGPAQYPGAKIIKRHDCYDKPCMTSLKFMDYKNIVLHEGDVIYRHLQNGDVCLFNRQPSLHRMSMMGMKVHILPGKTFKMNVSDCEPFNADFDGDEMNAHAPQSIMAHEELKQITLVPTQIISPSKCKPLIRLVQDTLVGAFLMTQDSTRLTKRKFCNLMMNITNFTGKFPEGVKGANGVNEYTGRNAYSMLLPEISFQTTNKSKENFVIKNGCHISGSLDSSIIGGSGLIQNILNTFGVNECKKFINETQNISIRWLEEYGFSVGVEDGILPNKEVADEIDKVIEKKISESNEQIMLAYHGQYEKKLDDELKLYHMDKMMKKIAAKCESDVVSIIVKNLPADNRFKTMFMSGAKGSNMNLQQIMGLVGQTEIWGNRISDGYSNRTLPHFHKYDFGLISKGFVKNSFMKGLSPPEFFFGMIGGRTGKIDSAIKTAEAGYISRKLVKAEEDVKVLYDGTVRNASNNIIQFVYGDDNFDPIKLEIVKLTLIEYNNLEMDNKYLHNISATKIFSKYWNLVLTESVANIVVEEENKIMEVLNNEYQLMYKYRDFLRNKYYINLDVMNVSIFLPFNLYRFINIVKNKFNIGEGNISNIHPLYIIEKTDELCKSTQIVSYAKSNDIFPSLMNIVIKSSLSTKQVIVEHRLSKLAFDYLITELKNKIVGAFVQAGEMVGPVGAQSLGEANTQLILNTFHSAGSAIGSVVVTSGVPRMKEIIDLSKSMKTPSMTLYLKEEYSNDRNKAEDIKNMVDFTKLRNIIYKTEILYETVENNDLNIKNSEDIEFIKLYYEFNDLICVDKSDDLSNWTLRMEFNKEIMLAKNIMMFDIQNAIMKNNRDGNIQCIVSDDNSSNLIMRIRVRNEPDEEEEQAEYYITFLKQLESYILDMSLRGIKNVKNSNLVETNIVKYNTDGSYSQIKKWAIQTDGSNLADAMLLDNIDKTRSTTNDIIETYEIFGIEGARMRIIKELETIFKENGINSRHTALLSDVMTNRGILMPINRHGINRTTDSGPISKASFEEISETFFNSAIFGEKDKINGVSANIMFGQASPIGTNMFEILLDENKLMKYADTEQSIPVFEEASLNEKQISTNIHNMYQDNTPELQITDNDFNFGYKINMMQDKKLAVPTTATSTTTTTTTSTTTTTTNKAIQVEEEQEQEQTLQQTKNIPIVKKVKIAKKK